VTSRAQYYERKAARLCVFCQAGLQETDGVTCLECREKHARWRSLVKGKKSRQRASRRRLQHRRELGLCLTCAAPAAAPHVRCVPCLEANRLWRKS